METKPTNLPSLNEIISEEAKSYEHNALTVLLNQPPPAKWLRNHPTAKIKNDKAEDIPLPYIPIDKVEYLLTRMFIRWWVDVLNVQCIANSVCVTVRLHVINPISGEEMTNDGVGAVPIQTDKGAGAMDWNKAKSVGVMLAAPAAESFAFKDAAEKFGRIFGKDLGRRDLISYDSIIEKPKLSTVDQRFMDVIASCKTVADLNKLRPDLANANGTIVDAFGDKMEELQAKEEGGQNGN